MATTLLAAAAKSAAPDRSAARRTLDALPQIRTNVSSPERWLSFIGGTAMTLYGLSGRETRLLPTLLGGYPLYRAATGHCPGYQAMGISMSDTTNPNAVIAAGHGARVECSVVINRPLAELYRYWRDFENLPRIMSHLVDVDTTTDGRSHWIAKAPLGMRVVWDAEIVTDIPGEVIGWKSLDGADVDTAGSVRFRPLDNGCTEVRVNLKYDPPMGQVGRAVAMRFGEAPEVQVREDLNRFKQQVESTGMAR
jgi:uncharacterized membrane protein